MFSFFAYPVYFYSLIVVLLAVSMLAIFSMGEEDKKARKERQEKDQEALLHSKELEKALAELKEKLNKASNELALSNEMYNGLKGQYGELEEKFMQLSEELLKGQVRGE